MGLRVFLLSPGKRMRWLIEVHDRSEWDAYFDGYRPAAEVLAETVRPVLGRGKGWVALRFRPTLAIKTRLHGSPFGSISVRSPR